MEIQLERVSSASTFELAHVRDRARSAPDTSVTSLFRLLRGGREVGLAVLDIFPNDPSIVLYELFIDPSRRREGIGTSALSTIEAYTRTLGRSQVCVIPHPISPDFTASELRLWYASRGYIPAEDDPHLFCKQL
jgi:GNAT superfamily N-acetyltransferase